MYRFARVSAYVLLALALPSVATAAEPRPLERVDPQQYAIESSIVDCGGGEAVTQALPKVTVFAHKRATITEMTQRPFVVAVSDSHGAKQPVIEVLSDGRTIDLTCHASGSKVTVDLTIEETRIDDVEVRQIDDETNIQVPRVEHSKLRRFVTVKPGEPFKVALDGKAAAESNRYIEFVVSALGVSQESLELRGLAPRAGDNNRR